MKHAIGIPPVLIAALLISAYFPSTAHALAVGATTGELSVNRVGAANYTIPIDVAPGMAGIQPQLALTYSSHNGNSKLGVGWSLGGLSAIHRCPATREQDGFAGDLNYDTDDRLCLDGARMIPFGPWGTEEATEYRADGNIYTRIVGYGSQGSEGAERPAWFKVWTKDGHIMEYGNTTDSRIEAWSDPGNEPSVDVRVWNLNKVSDVVGNYMTFEYFEDSSGGEYHPTKISYTFNDAHPVPVSFTRTVEFEYEPREDVQEGYFGGYPVQTSQRLRTIVNKISGEAVRTYTLNYEPDLSPRTNISRLSSIQQCGKIECLPLTQFSWSNGATTLLAEAESQSAVIGDYRGYEVHQADFDGDGVTDILFWNKETAILQIHLVKDGAMQAASTTLSGLYRDSEVFLGDFVPDGITDVLLLRKSGSGNTNYRILEIGGGQIQSTISGKVKHSGESKAVVDDVNGDGIPDVVTWSNSVYVYLGTPAGELSPIWAFKAGNTYAGLIGDIVDTESTLMSGDVNGDGVADLIFYNVTSSAFHFYLMQDGQIQRHVAGPPDRTLPENAQVLPGDYNGDGITDFAFWRPQLNNGMLYVWLFDLGGNVFHNLGSFRFTPDIPSHPSGENRYYKVFAGDYNGDGITEFLAWDTVWSSPTYGKIGIFSIDTEVPPEAYGYKVLKELYTGTAPGEGFTHRGNFKIDQVSGFYPGDYNGDGLTDVFFWDKELPANARIALGQANAAESRSVRPDLLTGITVNLLETESKIFYRALTDTSPRTVAEDLSYTISDAIYTKGTDATYPVIDMAGPMYVVDYVLTSNGLGARILGDPKNLTAYSYQHAKIALNGHGKGFLGFESTKEFDHTSGITTMTTYALYKGDGNAEEDTAHYSGQIASIETAHNGKRLTFASNKWQIAGRRTTNNFYVQTLLDMTVEEVYEIETGPVNSLVTRTTIDYASYDVAGNPQVITETIEGAGNTYSTTTTNQYDNIITVNDWILGRLKKATVSKKQITAHGGREWADSPGVSTIADTAVRTSTFSYYPNGLLHEEIVEPQSSDWLKTTYTYDDWGNRDSVKVEGPDVPFRTTSTVFRGASGFYGYFAASASNAKNHTENYTDYDERFGAIKSVTGPNDLTTTTTYDDFGRRKTMVEPGNVSSSWTYGWCNLINCPVLRAYSFVTAQRDGSPTTTTYFDKFQREIRTVTTSFNGTDIVVDTIYNAKGEVVGKSRNRYAADTAYWSGFEYDEIGRVIRECTGLTSAPDPTLNNACAQGIATDGIINRTEYDGLETRVFVDTGTGGKNQLTTRLNNALGKLIRVQDADGNATHYDYTWFGSLNFVKDPLGYITAIEYDRRGRKTAITDPDMGRWSYTYYANGELKSQTDAMGQITTMTYDELGRMVFRKDTSGTSTWTYDTATKGKGKLHRVSNGNGTSEEYSYNSLSLVENVTYNLGMLDGNRSYVVTTDYDSFNRVQFTTYPDPDPSDGNSTRYKVENKYNTYGYLSEVMDVSNSRSVWRADTLTADGQIELAIYGAGTADIVSERQFIPETGAIHTIETDAGLSEKVQNLEYDFDRLGNLTWRKDLRASLTESFCYDQLNRLTHASVGSILNCASPGDPYVQYDEIGNITYKAGKGYYQYLDRPHAVSFITPGDVGGPSQSAGDAVPDDVINALDVFATVDQILEVRTAEGDPDCTEDSNINVQDPVCILNVIRTNAGDLDGYERFEYDANGNMTHGINGRSITWTPFNKPRTITGNGNSIHFDYNADRKRLRQTGSSGTVLYLGPFQKETKSTGTDNKYYIQAGGQLVAVHVERSDTTTETLYMHADHLGSVDAITAVESSTVVVKERFSFDPWGKRRTEATWQGGDPAQLASGLLRDGYTGHEQLDDVGLVHMNARIYDPDLGRFLSPDTIVQSPGSTQGFNRYTYVNNNPLANVDPSGHSWLHVAAIIGTYLATRNSQKLAIIGSMAMLALVPAALPAGIPNGVAAVAGGFASGAVQSHSVEGAIFGAISAGLFYTVGGIDVKGSGFFGGKQLGKSLAHGLVGGAMSSFMGGDFKSGFRGSFFVQQFQLEGFAPGDGASARAMRVTAAAVIGGTATELGGGKFANGAKTVGFMSLLTESADYYENAVGRKANPLPGKNQPGRTRYIPDNNGQQLPADRSMGVIGLNREMDGTWLDFFTQGGPLSKALNIIPTMNATAGLHDYWFNDPNGLSFTPLYNFGTMLPAAAISLGASIGNLTQGSQSDPMALYLLTQPYDRDRRR